MMRIAFALVVGFLLALVREAPAEELPAWTPLSSERLVKLPPQYLKKSLEHDFADSALAGALRGAEEDIAAKGRTIGELQDAVAAAEGAVRGELRQQLLAEKQAYVKEMRQRSVLQRRELETRRRVLEQTLSRLGAEAAPLTPARAELVARQEQARARFQAAGLDAKIAALSGPVVPESRYAHDYAVNQAALESLARAIASHPMNAGRADDGAPRSREDYVRALLGETEAGLALLDQEEQIIAAMARLVALDAAALSAQLAEDEPDTASPRHVSPAAAVPLFLNR